MALPRTPRDGRVFVWELMRGIGDCLRITNEVSGECARCFDRDGGGEVTIDELIRGVNSALIGCPVAYETLTPVPTRTASPTPTPTLQTGARIALAVMQAIAGGRQHHRLLYHSSPSRPGLLEGANAQVAASTIPLQATAVTGRFRQAAPRLSAVAPEFSAS